MLDEEIPKDSLSVKCWKKDCSEAKDVKSQNTDKKSRKRKRKEWWSKREREQR
jgi:hypothetical protein